MGDAKVIEVVNFFKTSLESDGIRINDLILFGSSRTGTLHPGNGTFLILHDGYPATPARVTRPSGRASHRDH